MHGLGCFYLDSVAEKDGGRLRISKAKVRKYREVCLGRFDDRKKSDLKVV